MNTFEHIFSRMARTWISDFPMIVCLYTGSSFPPKSAPMPRCPLPEVGMNLDETFPEHLKAALAKNHAVHDGVVMIGRESVSAQYAITGWSYRLFPSPTDFQVEANRGSAFNSCLAMSARPEVDCLYIISDGSCTRFRHGETDNIS